jgi:polysaccharide deacetylase 2 family uncharacterized protein YibQ
LIHFDHEKGEITVMSNSQSGPVGSTDPTTPAKSSLPKPIILFWAVLIAGFCGGAGYLEYLGPPAPPVQAASNTAKAVQPPATASTKAPSEPGMVAVSATLGTGSELTEGAPIPTPFPALLTPSSFDPSWKLPHVGSGGLTPMRAYAANAAAEPGAPRIAIMVAGIGYNRANSLAAIKILPPAISLAVSPYAEHLDSAMSAARATGHEILLGIPLQPKSAPLDSAGNEALLPGENAPNNEKYLDWILSRTAGYAGTTNAIGTTSGGGFMEHPEAVSWLTQSLAAHGLFFVDAHANAPAPPFVWGRGADVVINPNEGVAAEQAQLAVLIGEAKAHHTALGVLTNPAPDEIAALNEWCKTLAGDQIALVPVSSIVAPPDATEASK